MPTVILVRHGRTAANAAGTLAGRLPGVALDDVGRGQATAAGERLQALRLTGVVTSPLERCRQTASAIVSRQEHLARASNDKGLVECDYGDWQGRALKELSREKLFKLVQSQPSAATFPNGESMRSMQDRAVATVRRHDALFAEAAGPDAVWVAVSHGDVIKAILADALGVHLDLFQRIHVDPASMSIVRYHEQRPTVLATNSHSGDLSWLKPPRRRSRARTGDAAVGGGGGPAEAGPRS